MTYIKKLVMHGFKSFAQKTEVIFDKGINIFIGPNGSGKSNISDALCFVLGRLSTKSIRAAKAKNLLFMGSKYTKPSREAMVELVFDNSDHTFSVERNEISIARTVRHNGLSIYRINGEVKTRADVVETLAKAGIDAHGFNLVLQGQIQAVVRMHPEDRRKIVEEVAGISIYEARKEKSLHELEKTEGRLKEINAILRERTAFLRNLENERQQALKFKELEQTVSRCKASILSRRVEDKMRELISVHKSIEEKTKQKDKLRANSTDFQQQIEIMNERILQINKYIQKATGLEQEELHGAIADLKAELEGLRVRKENHESKKSEIERRIHELTSKSLPELELEVLELRQKSPLVAKKQAELAKKKEELSKIEEEKKHVYAVKTEFNNVKDRLREKENELSRIEGESQALMQQLETYSTGLVHADEAQCKHALDAHRSKLTNIKKDLEKLTHHELESARHISVAESEINSAQAVIAQVEKLDVCPLCKSTITSEHIGHVKTDAQNKISNAESIVEHQRAQSLQRAHERKTLQVELVAIETKCFGFERELSRHLVITEKKDYLRRIVEREKALKTDITLLTPRRDMLQSKTSDMPRLEEQSAAIIRAIQEISSRSEQNLDQTLMFKEQDIERIREVIKSSRNDLEEVTQEIAEFEEAFERKSTLLEHKESEEAALTEKFNKLFNERDNVQKKIQEIGMESSHLQTEWRQIEDQVNFLKIGDAKLSAEREALEMELGDYKGLELIKSPLHVIEERLQRSTASLQTIGSINLRALEIYDEIKQEYDRVQEKVNTLLKEKEDILKIVEEIDNKKRRTFMKTYSKINELFSSNFARLSTKGQAFLRIDNEENIFKGGVSIGIRMQKGKYFDVTSLSGGEQTLVALSLLFAIQEYKPYHFYIFDEIDAALDKRNSERLSALLKQYMKSGQYITITHNDALILDANIIYGVSMHEGVSKILSLDVRNRKTEQPAEQLLERFSAPDIVAPAEALEKIPADITAGDNSVIMPNSEDNVL